MVNLSDKVFTLRDGTKIPAVGLGCWMGTPGGGERVFDMCQKALKHGYRHFDTAAGYGNEEEVGRAIRASGIPRSEIYLTTKLANIDHHRVREAFEESLAKLDLEYIDLYLLHWPLGVKDGVVLTPEDSPTFIETYLEMEKLLATGKVKSIGVSNFSIKNLSQLLEKCTVVPVTNQVELHPCLPQDDLKEFCESKGILLTAYSPLGRRRMLEDPTVESIAQRLGVTTAQVLLSWGVQRGTIVIPKTENEERIQANFTLPELSEEDMKELSGIHHQPGQNRSLLGFHTPEGKVFGWTYEQLGWNMTTGGVVPQ
ncbi:hypothetical protein AX16_004025 [Volvariella volvacea WC 439]|nr:hypothetical protein AX16_004025 [Volvariella volvacea WC 439]